ncbi:ubiquitin carboxyl-terminal hydrolase 27 isoform X1 [Coffea eugenioides]|uniref:ubiquitin carboxyl-terminal hydrolase 27 isoform X1 n=1 Tax=Coffea eugenioides TaxID=49369 RepID=UPI000F613C71|nr:ubiquitin carboxyl-terminal hydrolase 27 isoform X1 [Coffea eugenioides]
MKIQGRTDIQSLVEKLKFGAKFLPQVNWSSPTGLHISVAASLLGATGFILAIKDGKVGSFINFGLPWSSSDGLVSSDKNWVVPGLQNLGNNCFLNVVLQALASCSSFQRFLDIVFEKYKFPSVEESAKALPLTAAVASLLEELCMVQYVRSVRSPRKVMVAMETYMPSFSLTSQQDAEEAFFHLLASLREELSESYVHWTSSLADATVLNNSRILAPRKRLRESEQQRWRRSFLGPFDGILGSILTCQSCSFQISLDFQLFHSLHLSPVLSSGGTIMTGCSLESCLSQFFVSERLDNYFCSHCWHNAAIKYLSLTRENKTDIEKLKLCSEDDSCDCKSLCSLRPLPWSNSYSRSFKQLSMARSPQILCVHLQRASVNLFGELVKIQGHISFPLILDLSPFMKRGLVIKSLEENLQRGQVLSKCQPPFPCPMQPTMENATGLINCNGETANKFPLEAENPDHEQTVYDPPKNVHGIKTWPKMPGNGSSVDFMMNFRPIHSNDKVDGPSTSTSSKDHTYRLVSVVQHFGKVGSGHYTVYRRVKAETCDEDPIALLEPTHARWFCISDSEVHGVSEKDVLEAEASLLFYEKIH